MTKAIIIDSAKREVREADIDTHKVGQIINGWIECAAAFPNGDMLFVDEEGLLKPNEHFFRFAPRNDGLPLAGNGVIIGREIATKDSWYNEEPKCTVEQVKEWVTFLDKSQAQAWGKANASEPAVSVTAVMPDGSVEHSVLQRYGELFRDMTETATYTYAVGGSAADKQTWAVAGEITVGVGQFREAMDAVLLEVFQRLTEGKAVFGQPGKGCNGPYRVVHFALTARA